jgi:hypothetical protein
MTDLKWEKLTEAQRIKAGFWSRREWTSVSDAWRGFGKETAKLAVEKTFGDKFKPKPATQADIHCYLITNKAGRKVRFNLKYCQGGTLRNDL